MDKYEKGAKLMQRFFLSLTHEDVIGAFDYKITIPAIQNKLRKMLLSKYNNDSRNNLLKHLYK